MSKTSKMQQQNNPDKLDLIFQNQKAFQDSRGKFNSQYSIDDTKNILLAMHSEISDLLNCFKWKPNQKPGDDFIIGNVHEELVDLLKYWLIVANIWNFGPAQIVEEYFKKTAVVEQRWKQEFDLNLGEHQCAVFDIDGVLCDYVGTWYKFLEKEGITPLVKRHELKTLDISITVEQGHYVYLKDKYRGDGEKKNALVNDGAQQLLQSVKKAGYKIVVVSARPVKEYHRIFSDTIFWLKNNGLNYDAIFFEENKREWVLSHLKNVVFCVDDDPKQVERLSNSGLLVYMPITEYNKNVPLPQGVQKIQSLSEIVL